MVAAARPGPGDAEPASLSAVRPVTDDIMRPGRPSGSLATADSDSGPGPGAAARPGPGARVGLFTAPGPGGAGRAAAAGFNVVLRQSKIYLPFDRNVTQSAAPGSPAGPGRSRPGPAGGAGRRCRTFAARADGH